MIFTDYVIERRGGEEGDPGKEFLSLQSIP